MTMFVRWKRPQLPLQQEYFEVAKAKWVPCEAQMVKFWLSEGHVIHSNPRFDPTFYLVGAKADL